MVKVFIATHKSMADGIKETIEFLSSISDLTSISCFTDCCPELDDLANVIENCLKEKNIVVVFTDIFGGSINTKVSSYLQEYKNLYVVSGVNLPMVLDFLLSCNNEDNIELIIRNSIDAGKNGILLVNDLLKGDVSND